MRKATSVIGEAELSDLIGQIYDCAIEPSRWDGILQRLCGILDCFTCGLGVMDMHRAASRMQKLIGIEPEWAARMPEYAEDVANMFSSLPDLSTRPLDEPFVARRDVAPDVLSNRYWSEWATPQGLLDMISLHLMRGSGRFAAITFGRHKDVGPITDREVHMVRLLAPHLRRAIIISDLIEMKSIEADALGQTLDRVPAGVILVSEDAEILYANSTAGRMINAASPVFSAGGRLSAADRATTRQLQRTVAAAARSEAAIGSAGIGLALKGHDGPPATAHVLPILHGAARARLAPRGAAAIFIASEGVQPPKNLQPVADLYGLSRAETRLLERLMQGDSLAGAASALFISQNTAKTHLSRIFAKTETKRQASLVALVDKLVPPVAPPNDPED